MNERIKEIRKSENLTQQKFADKLGVKRNTVAQWELGINALTPQVITSICREFNISEEWLRTGNGEKYVEEDIEFSKICSKIGIKDEKAKKAITEYWHLSDEDKELFWKFMDRFIK